MLERNSLEFLEEIKEEFTTEDHMDACVVISSASEYEKEAREFLTGKNPLDALGYIMAIIVSMRGGADFTDEQWEELISMLFCGLAYTCSPSVWDKFKKYLEENEDD